MIVEGKEEKNILNNEIESWKGFEYALREENRLLFSKMLSESQQYGHYAKAAADRSEPYCAESFFMALIFQQQKR
jgi:hypothetical protein